MSQESTISPRAGLRTSTTSGPLSSSSRSTCATLTACAPPARASSSCSTRAAVASVPRSVKDPQGSHESNINGTLNLLIAARDAGVRRIVYAASSSAYGDQPTQPKHEEMLPSPLSPYAVQKLTCEYYIQSFYHSYGLEGVCLRYFNIFGPHQAADSPYSGVIAQFIFKMMEGTTPTIFGDGLTSRDFTFVDNAVNANLLACQAPSSVATGRVFNVGTGKSRTLNEVYEGIAGSARIQTAATLRPNPRGRREAFARQHRARAERARLRSQGRLSAGSGEDRRVVSLGVPQRPDRQRLKSSTSAKEKEPAQGSFVSSG